MADRGTALEVLAASEEGTVASEEETAASEEGTAASEEGMAASEASGEDNGRAGTMEIKSKKDFLWAR